MKAMFSRLRKRTVDIDFITGISPAEIEIERPVSPCFQDRHEWSDDPVIPLAPLIPTPSTGLPSAQPQALPVQAPWNRSRISDWLTVAELDVDRRCAQSECRPDRCGCEYGKSDDLRRPASSSKSGSMTAIFIASASLSRSDTRSLRTVGDRITFIFSLDQFSPKQFLVVWSSL